MISFLYDSEGNLTEDKSKGLKISYDWRGMPIEFIQESQPTGSSSDNLFKLTMSYDGSGRRISKTRWVKNAGSQDWEKELVTHYTGIGTEIREDFSKNQTKVVVNMPEGFGRYGVEDASKMESNGSAGEIPMMSFEWYIKNHLGSTMLVYGTQGDAIHYQADFSKPLAAYDYRAFGEMVELVQPRTGKVTENFTGKEHDDEIALDYFGARYLDPMLGMWISVDPARQFTSPYLYVGNGYNPVNGFDPDGSKVHGTYDRSTNQVVLTDDNPARGSRTFYAVSGYHNNPNKKGGIIPAGKYEIFERSGKNWFSLLFEGSDGKYHDTFKPEKGADTRGTFRIHRYHRGTNGCLSVLDKVDDPDDENHYKHMKESDYNELFKWIQGTETGIMKDSEGKERIDYGSIEVIGTPPSEPVETID